MSEREARLYAIEDRMARATPGPWFTRRHNRSACGVSNVVHVQPLPAWKHVMGEDGFCAWAVDAEFIAHSREDVEWLVAEVRRLERIISVLPREDQEEGRC